MDRRKDEFLATLSHELRKRRIRSRYPERHAAIVALTGWGQEEDRRQAREAGFDHHLVKSAEITALQSLLASL